MQINTDGLIIREQSIGESDRLVTVLTREQGILRAFVRGAKAMKSRSASSTQLLCYSRLSIYEGREKYIIDDAQPIQVFFDLRSDLEKLALAQYFCELAGLLAPQEEPAEDILRLMLNALHLLGNGRREPRQVKAVLELRLLAHAGFMPDLTACSVCGGYDGAPMWFHLQGGVLTCRRCAERQPPDTAPVGGNVLAAMRHILYSPLDKAFSFSMTAEGLKALANASEAFLLAQLGRGFHTLDFYHTFTE